MKFIACSLISLLAISNIVSVSSQSGTTAINMKKTQCRPGDAVPGPAFLLRPERSAKMSAPDRVVYGTIEMLDGCRFRASNFTMKPPGLKTYWTGIPKGQPADLMLPKVVTAALGSYDSQTAEFTLNGVSWADMDGIGVYSEGDQAWYLRAFWAAEKVPEDSAAGSFLSVVTVSGFLLFATVTLL